MTKVLTLQTLEEAAGETKPSNISIFGCHGTNQSKRSWFFC